MFLEKKLGIKKLVSISIISMLVIATRKKTTENAKTIETDMDDKYSKIDLAQVLCI